MRITSLILLLSVLCGSAAAQVPPGPDEFFAGVFADDARTMNCVSGPAGSSFDIYAFAWVPPGSGLTYVTLRFDFPENIEMAVRPLFNELVIEVIVIDYDDGTVEWTMLFSECPSGWIELFRQRAGILDAARSDLLISEDNSMIRDCDFVLNDIVVLGGFAVNDPGCTFVSTDAASWGAVKSLFRQYRQPFPISLTVPRR